MKLSDVLEHLPQSYYTKDSCRNVPDCKIENNILSIKGFISKELLYELIRDAIKIYDLNFGVSADDELILQKNTAPYQVNIQVISTPSQLSQQAAASFLINNASIQFYTPDNKTYTIYLSAVSAEKYLIYVHLAKDSASISKFIPNRIYFLVQQFASSHFNHLEEIAILPSAEKSLINSWSSSRVIYPEQKTIIALFENIVRGNPSGPALVFENSTFSFSQLNKQANQLAHYLISKGVKTESYVPICLPRSAEMIIALLAILKAGGAYVPIDPDYRADRIDYIIDDTAAQWILSTEGSLVNIPQKKGLSIIDLKKDAESIKSCSVKNIEKTYLPGDIAYVIYTSGSTGRPKGVMIEHKALLDHCFGLKEQPGISACQSFALFAPLIFDAGHSIIHTSFILGATLHVLSAESLSAGNLLQEYVGRHSIDCIKIVPSLWLSYSDEGSTILANKVMIFGGDIFSKTLLTCLRNAAYAGIIYNHYGPTEATIGKCIFKVDNRQMSNIPIGKPFGNTRLYILNAMGKQTGIGMPGELFIAGDGLARGYLNQPSLTAKNFINNHFNKLAESRLYKTGDVVKWLPDGNIEYLGRKDEQVKIRGHRIELGEIESVIQQSRFVTQAIVLAKSQTDGTKYLVAYVVKAVTFNLDILKDHLRRHLPDYMLPIQWIEVNQIPLTINGKTDKKALSKIGLPISGHTTFKAPDTPLELALSAIWKRLLKLEEVGVDDHFLELGGHSLLAMRLCSAIRNDLQLNVSVPTILRHPTIALLADHLLTSAQNETPSLLGRLERPRQLPLSFSQERLWFIHQASGSLSYCLPSVLSVKGDLKINVLSGACRHLLKRHDTLRTIIRDEEGQIFQVVQDEKNWNLNVVDISNDSYSPDELIQQEIETPFDLANDYMFRTTVIKLGYHNYLLVFVLHHIATDGWSADILNNELSEIYNAACQNKQAQLKALAIKYSDYALWQKAQMAKHGFLESLDYWKQNLKNVPNLQLPLDYQRPSIKCNKGGVVQCLVESDLTYRLQLLSGHNDTTLFTTLLSTLNILLCRYSGQNDICIGTPVAGRSEPGLEDLAGFFVNTLAIRTHLSPETTFITFLQQVKESVLNAFAHQDAPFEKVVEIVAEERDLSRSTLFQVMLVLENMDEKKALSFNNLQITPMAASEAINHSAKFDITFVIAQSVNGLTIRAEYASSLFSKTTVENLVNHFKNLLLSIADNPFCPIDTLPILSKNEQKQLLHTFNNNGYKFDDSLNIIKLFTQQAALNPNALAARFNLQTITYKQLDERSNQLANYLGTKNIPGQYIPLCTNRNIDMLVGIFGIIKAGYAYVPIDMSHPANRIEYILQDVQAEYIVCTNSTCHLFSCLPSENKIIIDCDNLVIERQAKTIKNCEVDLASIAYVIYTSGSTGKPKGTLITHKGLMASTTSRRNYYGNPETVLLIPSIAFDSSVAVIFGTLISGGTLLLCSHDKLKEPAAIQSLLQHTQTLLCVPSYYRMLLQEDLVGSSKLSTVIVAGETLDEPLVNLHFDINKNCRLYNEYGPTEATVWSTVAEIEKGNKVTIGKPVESVFVYILDEKQQLVPVGVKGELCLGGPQVAAGYLNLPDLTSSKFIEDPFSTGNLMYRSGDLARWLPNGTIECIGRKDDQVKIRGNRVEPGEIENILQQCPAVKMAAVLPIKDKDGNSLLVAYIVAKGLFDKSDLVGYLSARLPVFMMPAAWIAVKQFPLTANGKINKTALSEAGIQNVIVKNFIAPSSAMEQQIAEIWKQLLNVTDIDVHDNFFSSGGHSLLVIKLAKAINDQFRSSIAINDLFLHATIFDQAVFLKNKSANLNTSFNQFKYLAPVKSTGDLAPLYIVAGGGSTALKFKQFSAMLHPQQPVFALQAPFDSQAMDEFPSTIQNIAQVFVAEILKHNPEGPYLLSGHCLGGFIAFEMAKQLQQLNKKIHSLILFDTVLNLQATESQPVFVLSQSKKKLTTFVNKTLLKIQFEGFLMTKHPRQFFSYKLKSLMKLFPFFTNKSPIESQFDETELQSLRLWGQQYYEARKKYQMTAFDGDIILFYATERYYFNDIENNVRFKKISLAHDIKNAWANYAKSVIKHEVKGDHTNMFDNINGQKFAALTQQYLVKKHADKT